MSLDVHAMGVQVADCVLNLLASGTVRSYTAPLPRLVARGTTTTAPAATTAEAQVTRGPILRGTPAGGWVGA